jgi:hypothetical protein
VEYDIKHTKMAETNADNSTTSEGKSTPSKVKKTSKSTTKKNVVPKVSNRKSSASKATKAKPKLSANSNTNFPKHSVEKALRIPRALLEQNAGKECSESDAARYCNVGYSGQFQIEISSGLKYGFLERPAPRQLKPTELAKKIIRPQSSSDELNGFREAVINAPVISDVYKHYRGENLPDRKFFENTLTETFNLPNEKLSEFIDIFLESLEKAKLVEKTGDKYRILDISSKNPTSLIDTTSEIKKLSRSASVSASDTCFVMMPFAAPLGDYYAKIYEPAILKAGLKPLRADNDIFGTGKIIDQIWNGITSAKVLIAELTNRNPNVYYELGLAHALKKPVVLICSNEEDVPFDLKHIRVIYYDVFDPFWGSKLIDKVAENILSAISNPNEAMLFQ